MSDENNAKMYVTFTCVDCNQKFATRKELEEHEISKSLKYIDNGSSTPNQI
jgi:hypothetical protein